MKNGLWMLLLMVAATLESGGDALVRTGLHSSTLATRLSYLVIGGGVLFVYGVVVNLPPWDFGRLLGVYVAMFFLVAQVINRVAFGVIPTPPIFIGGAFIIVGAMIVTFWRAGA
jgi:drug/metabolite transporter superfamily protein YnfA